MIFDLKDASNWDPIVKKAIGNILGCSYSDTIKKSGKRIKYRDSEDEGCNIFSARASKKELIDVVTKELSSNFTEVLAYHACRPSRIEDYYENGVMPLHPIEVQQQFREYFSPYARQIDIDIAIAAVSTETRGGVRLS